MTSVMTSVASIITTSIVICDSSSEDENGEDEETSPAWSGRQAAGPVQYKVLDVFGDNALSYDKNKTSESIIIEDDEDEGMDVGVVKSAVNEDAIDLTEGADNTEYTDHTMSQRHSASEVRFEVVDCDEDEDDDLIVMGDSNTIHHVQEKEVLVYGTVTSDILEACQDETLTEEEPRPVSDPIMNLAFRDDVRWFMTPEDREIVPRWSAIQNGDMVDALCESDGGLDDSVDDVPVQYTTIEDVGPPDAPKTSKPSSAKKCTQSKRRRCSNEEVEFVPAQKPVKNNNKKKRSKKSRHEASAKKSKVRPQTVKHKKHSAKKDLVTKKVLPPVQTPANSDSSSKSLEKRRSGRTQKDIEACSLPPCCVRVCAGMMHSGTRVECPWVAAPVPRIKKQQAPDKHSQVLKQSNINMPNKKHKSTASNSTHRPSTACGTRVAGRQRFCRSAQTRQVVK